MSGDRRNRSLSSPRRGIESNLVSLRRATELDRRRVYEWLACSDVTPSMMGPPTYPDHPAPTWDEFCSDYAPHYFDGTDPSSGMVFIIEREGEPVGAVNYDEIDMGKSRTELDIWMSDGTNCGRGFGPDAPGALCRYLQREHGICEFVIRPSERNTRAIRAYEKAGFRRVHIEPSEAEREFGPGDYTDTVTMVMYLPTEHGKGRW